MEGRVTKWRVEPFNDSSKAITLVGPSDGFYAQAIYIDFDDVNHPEVERRVPLIVAALDALELGPPDSA